jgi:hypothetical protein
MIIGAPLLAAPGGPAARRAGGRGGPGMIGRVAHDRPKSAR